MRKPDLLKITEAWYRIGDKKEYDSFLTRIADQFLKGGQS